MRQRNLRLLCASATLAALYPYAPGVHAADNVQLARMELAAQLAQTQAILDGRGDRPASASADRTQWQTAWPVLSINNQASDLVLEVRFRPADNALQVRLADWIRAGLVFAKGDPNEQGFLDLRQLKGVSANYSASAQQLDLSLSSRRFQRQNVNLSGGEMVTPAPAKTVSAVLNYDLFSQWTHPSQSGFSSASNSGLFDARLATPWGNLQQSAIVRTPAENSIEPITRLDTAYKYFDTDNLSTLTVGDSLSAGIGSRAPIRFAGIQWQRSFSLRPELVTFPVPLVTGSGAVPSSVDLYVNQIRRAQASIPAGPYSLNQMPLLTGPNQVQLVVRDVLGRESVLNFSIFNTLQLLRPGLTDFSLQAGLQRLDYASISDRYEDHPFAIAALRQGINNRLTLQGQTEISRDVQLLSGGLVTLLGQQGSFGVDLAGSQASAGSGAELATRFDYYLRPNVVLNGSLTQASGNFRDIATWNLPDETRIQAREQLTLNTTAWANTSLSFSLFRQQPFIGSALTTAMFSAARSINSRSQLGASLFTSLDADRNWGANLYYSLFLDNRATLSANTQANKSGQQTTVLTAQTTLTQQPGWGWRVDAASGSQNYLRGQIQNRNDYSDLMLQAESGEVGETLRAGVSGAAVWMPGIYKFGRRVQDAFAIVDLGQPDIPVFFENRPVGLTGRDGTLLINSLNAFQMNKISIDANALPVDLLLDNAELRVVPSRNGGLHVGFPITRDTSVLLMLKLADGTSVPLGSRLMPASGDQLVIGYDGLVAIPASLPGQRVDLLAGDRMCSIRIPTAEQLPAGQALVVTAECP